MAQHSQLAGVKSGGSRRPFRRRDEKFSLNSTAPKKKQNFDPSSVFTNRSFPWLSPLHHRHPHHPSPSPQKILDTKGTKKAQHVTADTKSHLLHYSDIFTQHSIHIMHGIFNLLLAYFSFQGLDGYRAFDLARSAVNEWMMDGFT